MLNEEIEERTKRIRLQIVQEEQVQKNKSNKYKVGQRKTAYGIMIIKKPKLEVLSVLFQKQVDESAQSVKETFTTPQVWLCGHGR